MSQYDNFRDDEIIDQIDRDSAPGRNGSYYNYNSEGVGTGFGIGALIALAVILLIAWNTGYLEITPYQGSTRVTDLPISPPLAPTVPPATPQG